MGVRKISRYGRMLGFVVAVVILFFLAQMISGAMFGFIVSVSQAFMGIELTPELYNELLADNMIYIAILGGILGMLFFWLFFLIRNAVKNQKDSMLRYCRFKKASAPTLFFSLLAGVGFYLLFAAIMFFTQLPQYFPEHQQLLEPMFRQHVLISILGLGLVASLVEEIGFRGLIFNRMRQDLPLVVALILQAAIFGAMHMNVLQSSYAFILGILVGLIYVWTDSLWAPIIMHFAFNTSSAVVVQVLEIEETATSMGIFLAAGIVLFILSFAYLYKKRLPEQELTGQELWPKSEEEIEETVY